MHFSRLNFLFQFVFFSDICPFWNFLLLHRNHPIQPTVRTMHQYHGRNMIKKDVELLFKRDSQVAFYSKDQPIRDFILHYSDYGLDVKRLSWHKKLLLLTVRYGFLFFFWYLNLYAVRVITSCMRDLKKLATTNAQFESDYLVRPFELADTKKYLFKTLGLLLRIGDHLCLVTGLVMRDATYLLPYQVVEGIQLALQYQIYAINWIMGYGKQIQKEKVISTVFRTYVWLFTLTVGYYFNNSYLTESFMVRSRGYWF